MLLEESNTKILVFNKLGLKIFENEKTIQTTGCKAGGSVTCLCITTCSVLFEMHWKSASGYVWILEIRGNINSFLIQTLKKTCTHINLISAFLSCLICFTGALRSQLSF